MDSKEHKDNHNGLCIGIGVVVVVVGGGILALIIAVVRKRKYIVIWFCAMKLSALN